MDRTLNPNKRGNKKRKARNSKAWANLFGAQMKVCTFCGHDSSDHLMTSGQPHFFRPLAKGETMANVYTYDAGEENAILVKKVIVAAKPEIITLFCKNCAEDKNTGQAMCYHRTLATGELVGYCSNDSAGH